jgi:DNA-binding NtrC family response regulator
MADRIKLLIVDDEREFLEALGVRLEMRDFDVRLADGGDAALERCRHEKFDLAMVDLKMPGMDGKELLERLKAEHRYLEVIILTGHGSLSSAVECTRLGAFSYLPKPYDLEQLLNVLQAAFAERMRKKFAHDQERHGEIMELAQSASPLAVLRRMKELDDEER